MKLTPSRRHSSPSAANFLSSVMRRACPGGMVARFKVNNCKGDMIVTSRAAGRPFDKLGRKILHQREIRAAERQLRYFFLQPSFLSTTRNSPRWRMIDLLLLLKFICLLIIPKREQRQTTDKNEAKN